MLDTAATHIQERMANDRQRLRALLKGMGDVVPPDALRRSAFFFERQQLSWLNGLDGHGIMEAEQLAAAYDDALLRENRRNIFDWVRPTDPAAVHWAPPFRPERTVLPPGSNDERESGEPCSLRPMSLSIICISGSRITGGSSFP